MTDEDETLASLRCEYSEVNKNFRHYSALRFAAFITYLVVLASLIAVAFGVVGGFGWIHGATRFWWSKVAGLLFTIVFSAFEIFCELNLRHLRNIAKGLEEPLGFRQFRVGDFPVMSWVSYFLWGTYIIIILFWLGA